MSGWLETLHKWQTLAASTVAVIAAAVAWHNTSRTLKANAQLESQRRNQKHAALRSVLPLSLSELSAYCAGNVRALEILNEQCVDERLPPNIGKHPTFPNIPGETVKSFADFIEYADGSDTSLFQSMLARLQVSRARTRELEDWLKEPNEDTVIVEANIEEYIIDWATIYAGVAQLYDYARRKSETLPTAVTWENVRSALRNLRIWDPEFESIYETIGRREADSIAP